MTGNGTVRPVRGRFQRSKAHHAPYTRGTYVNFQTGDILFVFADKKKGSSTVGGNAETEGYVSGTRSRGQALILGLTDSPPPGNFSIVVLACT